MSNDGTGQRFTSKPPGRPGAMTQAMSAVSIKPIGPKVLRVGVIQSGKIVEERIIRKRETVTVGGSERNHFVINTPGLPARFELFQLVGSDYILNFTQAMSGRVGLPAGVQTLEQLRTSGAARNAGSHWQVKLNDSARGKVVVGDVTLLFQFVTPPPVQPRPQLPAAARGGFAKSIDWVFTAFVMFSFMTHFGFVVYLENADWPIATGIAAIPDEFVDLVMAEQPPPEPTEENTTEPAQPEATKAEEPKKEPVKQEAAEKPSKEPAAEKPAGEDKAAKEAAVAEATARMAEEAAASAEALLLGALGAQGGGALNDVLAGGAVTGNAEDVLAQAAGVGVATNAQGGTLRQRSGGGTGNRVGGLGSLQTAGGGGPVKEGGAVAEKQIRGTFKPLDPDAVGGTGDFDAKLVVAEVKKRISAIKICYEQQLRRDPSLQGKVTVQFTIEQSGTISKAAATENTTNDAQVAACVVEAVKRFRFNPGPEGGSVVFSYPFVFAPSN
ncbi:MAG: putative abductin-like protein [Myxococcaceae bacterium]|nr:putative abductin-like protein [Myxococcaceae bacterium]